MRNIISTVLFVVGFSMIQFFALSGKTQLEDSVGLWLGLIIYTFGVIEGYKNRKK